MEADTSSWQAVQLLVMRKRGNTGRRYRSGCSMFLLALGILFGSYARDVFSLRYQEASITILDIGITLTVIQYGGDRSLSVVSRNGNTLDQKLIADWGPNLRVNLYRVDSKNIAIMDFGDTFRISRDSFVMKSDTPSKDWKYLGTFVRLQQKLQFSPAGEADECMDILMAEPPPRNGRENIYRERC
ncbi:hypothetical protein AB4037_09580 [Labrys sp. KB_33_2]|uniref:hypothetical protein n=1 Tax=Labrys sp. KB_33_2 TaxID=3237479 RepID=UPI003F8FF2BE